MSGLATTAVALGAAVARTACQVWLGDHRLAAATGTKGAAEPVGPRRKLAGAGLRQG